MIVSYVICKPAILAKNYMKHIVLFTFFQISSTYSNEDLRNAVEDINQSREVYREGATTIYLPRDFQRPEFKTDFPRDEKSIASDEVINRADKFLHQVFGKNYEAHVMRVSLYRYSDQKHKDCWIWRVTYIDMNGQNTINDATQFNVFLSGDGDILMKSYTPTKSEK
jgi:hypothetical protein